MSLIHKIPATFWAHFKSTFTWCHQKYFWPIYAYWLMLLAVYPWATGYDSFLRGIHVFTFLFIAAGIGYFLYFHAKKEYKISSFFGGHLIAMWMLTPIYKHLLIFFPIFIEECAFDWNCAYVLYVFSLR